MEDGTGSIWNIDGAQFYTLFTIKQQFVEALRTWDLDDAYWAVRTLRMEIDAKLKRKEENKMLAEIEEEKAKRKNIIKKTEKEIVDDMMHELDIERETYLSNTMDQEVKSNFFKVLESFYMHLCLIMKKHHMYYREGDDNRLAILRR